MENFDESSIDQMLKELAEENTAAVRAYARSTASRERPGDCSRVDNDSAKIVVRSATDFIVQNKILQLHEQGVPFLCVSKNLTCPAGFKINEWASSEHSHPFFVNYELCYLFFEWGWVYAMIEGDEINLEATGRKKESEEWINSQKDKYGFLDKVKYINWMFGPNYNKMQVRRVPLDTTDPIPSAYPWIGKSVEEYAKDYLNDKASVLILIGPPGTGKTSFLKGLIAQMNGQACVTYDSHLLAEDGIFAQFTEDRNMEAMIFEDADNFIGSRKDGNQMMHRFLNVSNGLVSPMKGKKIIFTTNLPSADEIDPALIRPGRCYEVLHFRTLSFEEAKAVAKDFYGEENNPVYRTFEGECYPLIEDRQYTLAEITNLSRVGTTKVRRKVGFL